VTEAMLLRDRYQQDLRPYLGNPKHENLTLQLWIEAIEEDRATDRIASREFGESCLIREVTSRRCLAGCELF
jgi:hypothetical protein